MTGRKKKRRRIAKCVFTREVFDAIPAWVEMGARPEDIAAALGVTVGTLQVRCSQVRISLRPAVGGAHRLPQSVWGALQRAADRRNWTVPRLVSEVLVGVAERNLFAEVLEDRNVKLPLAMQETVNALNGMNSR